MKSQIRWDRQDYYNESETAPHRSPKNWAIKSFVLSYVLMLLALLSYQVRVSDYLTAFIVVLAIAAHMFALLCLAWVIEEAT